MIREYKQQARVLLKENFTKLFLPVFVLMLINLFGYAFYNFIVDYTAISLGIFEERMYMVLFFGIKVFVLSLTTTWIWKRCVSIVNNTTDEQSKKYLLGNMILINLIQVFLTALYTHIDAIDTYLKTPLYIKNALPLVALFLLLLRCYIFYKLICSNYIFFTENVSPIKAIKQSFSKVHHKWFWFLKLELSFILWDILITVIHITVALILQKLGYNTLYIGCFSVFGYGINFYLLPYKFLTHTLVAKNIVAKNGV